MTSASARLLEIKPNTSDKDVAALLTEKCIALSYPPYRFSINHDVRPPKNLACPLHYDWTRKNMVGIETNVVPRQWLTEAFIRGYTVCQTTADRKTTGFPHSIAIARRRVATHQIKDDDDDDIPF